MGVELRPLQASDMERWADLLAACEKADHSGEHYDADDLAEEFDADSRDSERDFIGAWLDDQLVGVATVFPRDQAEESHKVHLEGWTHPDHRGTGIGTATMAWSLERAREAHAAMFPDVPCVLETRALADDETQQALLSAAGLSPVRWFFTMEADLSVAPEALPLPDGLELRGYGDVASADVRDAHNAAFRDHWGFTPWSPTMWTQYVDETRSFRPEWSKVLVTPDGAIVAYVVMYEYEADAAATGKRTAYVGKVGTMRDWRRRGIASALLSLVLQDCRVNGGYPYATLDVDADNPTGALGVYERLGFVTTVRFVAYSLRLPSKP
jgi:ribosomal protein S18 acetylase RimI-like enzyme